MGPPPLLLPGREHRIHDHDSLHSQLLPPLHRETGSIELRIVQGFKSQTLRVLLHQRPLQMGGAQQQEGAASLHRKRRLHEAAGVTAPSSCFYLTPGLGRGRCARAIGNFQQPARIGSGNTT